MFPICSTSCFLLYQQNRTSSTPNCEGFSPPAQPFCNFEPPRHRAQPGVSSGSGAQGAAGVWAANKSEGGTKVLGILDQGSLTRWNPRRDALPVSQCQAGARTRAELREQGRSARLPGSPEVPRLQKAVARCFHFSFFLLGVLETTCKQPYPLSHPPTRLAPRSPRASSQVRDPK